MVRMVFALFINDGAVMNPPAFQSSDCAIIVGISQVDFVVSIHLLHIFYQSPHIFLIIL